MKFVSKPLNVNKSIDALKNKIVNQTYIGLSIMAFVAILFVGIRSFSYGFSANFYILSLLVLMMWSITIWRNRFGLKFKLYLIMFLVLCALISGLHQLGFLATSRIYILVIPIFISFLFDYKKSLILLICYMLVYITYAFLFTNNYLTYSYQLNSYVSSYLSWCIEGIAILYTSWGLLYVGTSFNKSLIEHSLKVEKQNNTLMEYINMNSHEVRGPLARILGLVKVYQMSSDEKEKEDIMNQLHESAISLDDIVKSMNRLLEKELVEEPSH